MASNPKYDYDPTEAIEELEVAYKKFDEMIKLDMFTPHVVEEERRQGRTSRRSAQWLDEEMAKHNHYVLNWIEEAQRKIRAKQKELRDYLANQQSGENDTDR